MLIKAKLVDAQGKILGQCDAPEDVSVIRVYGRLYVKTGRHGADMKNGCFTFFDEASVLVLRDIE